MGTIKAIYVKSKSSLVIELPLKSRVGGNYTMQCDGCLLEDAGKIVEMLDSIPAFNGKCRLEMI